MAGRYIRQNPKPDRNPKKPIEPVYIRLVGQRDVEPCRCKSGHGKESANQRHNWVVKPLERPFRNLDRLCRQWTGAQCDGVYQRVDQ